MQRDKSEVKQNFSLLVRAKCNTPGALKTERRTHTFNNFNVLVFFFFCPISAVALLTKKPSRKKFANFFIQRELVNDFQSKEKKIEHQYFIII